ncbi:hypothetical protein CSKR_102351 [Clonorchis sinensis]|uniref:Uncharacterized protein n=1 Tax=Clonorchis sinensis TaxID=79923 RepID=A0A3R7EV30_CLOSI|nr:hypothetical protein CSKR_102351 [Clonorchis sinensis]
MVVLKASGLACFSLTCGGLKGNELSGMHAPRRDRNQVVCPRKKGHLESWLSTGGMAASHRKGATAEQFIQPRFCYTLHRSFTGRCTLTQAQEKMTFIHTDVHDFKICVLISALTACILISFPVDGFLPAFAQMARCLEREFPDRKVRASNPTSAFRPPPCRLGQPGTIPALELSHGGMAVGHRNGATAEGSICTTDLKRDTQLITRQKRTLLR